MQRVSRKMGSQRTQQSPAERVYRNEGTSLHQCTHHENPQQEA